MLKGYRWVKVDGQWVGHPIPRRTILVTVADYTISSGRLTVAEAMRRLGEVEGCLGCRLYGRSRCPYHGKGPAAGAADMAMSEDWVHMAGEQGFYRERPPRRHA